MAKLIIIDRDNLTQELQTLLQSWDEDEHESFEAFEDVLADDDYEQALEIAKENLSKDNFNLLSVWIEEQTGEIHSYKLRDSIDPAIWNIDDNISLNIKQIENFEDLPNYYQNSLNSLTITDSSTWRRYKLNHYKMNELHIPSDLELSDINMTECSKIVVIDNAGCKVFNSLKELTENSSIKELDLSQLTHLSILNLEYLIGLKGLEKLYLPEKLETPLKEGESKPSLGLTLNEYQIPNNLEIIKHKEYAIRVRSKEKEQLLPHIKNI